MGIIIKSNMLAAEKDTYCLLVYCSAPSNLRDNAISINTKLAEKLLPLKPSRRTIRLEKCFNEIIDSIPEKSVIKVDGNSYYSFSELHDFDLLFPFEYKTSKEELMTNERFTVSTFGGEVSVSLSVSE